MYTQAKCKKCRKTLLDYPQCSTLFLNAHNQPLGVSQDECLTVANENVIFLREESLPTWIMQKIQEAEWSKGRLNCEHCDSRLGAFDFVSGIKCECSGHVLPPVHLIKSKVDLLKS